MMTITSVQSLETDLKARLSKMQAALAALFTEIERIKSDGSRHPTWIAEKVGEARQRAMATFSDHYRVITEGAARAKGDIANWSNTLLLLSRITLADEPENDAAMRAARLAEFSAMSPELLQAVADNAKAEGRLGLLFQAWLAGRQYFGQENWRGIDLEDVQAPNQAAALAALRNCGVIRAAAEHVVAEASGSGMTPTRKLALAREQQQA